MPNRVAATIESTAQTATNIRKRPSVDSPIIGNLKAGVVYEAQVALMLISDEIGSTESAGTPLYWMNVELVVNGKTLIGYVAESYVKVTFKAEQKEPRYWVDLLGMTVEVSESTLQEVIPLIERILEGLKRATKVGE